MNRNRLTALFILGAVLLTGCGNSASQSQAASVASAAPAASSTQETHESAEGKQIRLTTENSEVIVTLNDSTAAADLVEMLPLELTLIERNNFAKGINLPQTLTVDQPTTREYQVGDFGYWDAGPDLAIFYDDIYEQTVVPIIPLGHAESGAETLADETGTVRLELVDPPVDTLDDTDNSAPAVSEPSAPSTGGKTIIPFTVHGGSGFAGTRQTIARLEPGATIIEDGLSISRNSVADAEASVVDWVRRLG